MWGRERWEKKGGGEKGPRTVSLKLCEESGNVPGAGMRERKRLAWSPEKGLAVVARCNHIVVIAIFHLSQPLTQYK